MYFSPDLQYARYSDQQDSLADFRNRFYIKDPGIIYLDGNSLGRLPVKTIETINRITRLEWGESLIESWNETWYDMSSRLGDLIAGITGASKGEIILADNTSVNLYKLAAGALDLMKGRTKVVSDTLNFPTDLYILQGLLKAAGAGYTLELAGTCDGIHGDPDEMEQLIDENTALAVLSLVTFKSGYLYDMERITAMAHRKGALVLWDLSHATGAVPLELNKCNADLAVGCTYKYLNGGPGAPAFLYVRHDLQDKLLSPVQGWFAENDPFRFTLDFTPAQTVRKYMTGTPPILSMAAIEPGIELIYEAGIGTIREKSIRQGEYLLYLLKEKLVPLGFSSGSPSDPNHRGSHIAIKHPEAYRICQAMIHPKDGSPCIIPDFRDPDIIRLGITPLYTTYEELLLTISRMERIAGSREFEYFQAERKTVT